MAYLGVSLGSFSEASCMMVLTANSRNLGIMSIYHGARKLESISVKPLLQTLRELSVG